MKVEECSTWNMLGWSLRWQSTHANVGFRTAGSGEINYGIPTKRRVALTAGPRELPSTEIREGVISPFRPVPPRSREASSLVAQLIVRLRAGSVRMTRPLEA